MTETPKPPTARCPIDRKQCTPETCRCSPMPAGFMKWLMDNGKKRPIG